MLDDLRHILRGWRTRPAFATTCVATLTLSVALVGAVFAFADGYLFRPLPFASASQLYRVSDPNAAIAAALTATDTRALRASTIAGFGFVEWAVDGRASGTFAIGDRRVEVTAYGVSEGFRAAVGLPLLVGRDFAASDHRAGAAIPAWLSHRFWQVELGGDRGVLNSTHRLQDMAGARLDVRVVGILGPGVASFDLNNAPPDLVVPAPEESRSGPNALSFPIVRLPDGMSREDGQRRIAEVLQTVAPAPDGRPRVVRLRSLRDAQVAGGRPTAMTFLAGAMLIAVLATVNLVHLFLVRSAWRATEMATRAALGASRWRLTRLVAVEGLTLAAVGIAVGLPLAAWLAGLIEAQVPEFPTSGRNLSLVPMLFDRRSIVFAGSVGVIIALVAVCWPVWRTMRGARLWRGRSPASTAAVPFRASQAILACELALCTVAMAGTVFTGLGIWRYLNQHLGFEYTDRVSIIVRPSGSTPLTPLELGGAARAVRETPGVKAAGPHDALPLSSVEVPLRAASAASVSAFGVADGYFESWSLTIRAGRVFSAGEYAAAAPVAIVDGRFASMMWPGRDPVGQVVRVDGGGLRQIVGVVEAPRWSLAREAAPAVYVPIDRAASPRRLVAWIPGGTPPEVVMRLRAAVRAVVPDAELTIEPVSMATLFRREIGEARFQTPFMITIGALALTLAGIGVFGVVSYVVARRTREFGIRLALGARPFDVWRSVIWQSVSPALVGLVLGIAGARALERVVQASVFGWPSSGAWASALVAIALFTVAVGAATAPARRAMHLDPAATLRAE